LLEFWASALGWQGSRGRCGGSGGSCCCLCILRGAKCLATAAFAERSGGLCAGGAWGAVAREAMLLARANL